MGKLRNCMMKYLAGVIGVCLMLSPSVGIAKAAPANSVPTIYKPTVEDWVGVNAAVDNYTLGLELHDLALVDKAFWPEATITAQPEPGMSFTMPYKAATGGPPPPGSMPPGMPPPPSGAVPAGPPPGAPPMPPGGMRSGTNAIGNDIAPWHLALNHHFEFQSATRATHYGYFVSVYPDLKTKVTTVGLPGHYDDVLEKRNGEWRILQRKTVIGVK
jgi:hypothetical protein